MTVQTITLVTPTERKPIRFRLPVTRIALTTIAIGFLTLFVIVPAVNVFAQALANGWEAYKTVFYPPPLDTARLAEIDARLEQINDLPLLKRKPFQEERRTLMREHAAIMALPGHAALNWSSVRMTLGVAAVTVPMNILFGLSFAWAVTKFRFKGRSFLISIIELPFSVSPVVAGLIFVLLFGLQGFLANWSRSTDVLWLAPTVYALRWLPLVLLLAWIAFVIAFKTLTWLRPQRKEREAPGTVARNIILTAMAVVLLVLIGFAYTAPNLGWGWLLPTDWKWPDLMSLYWRGFSGEHWWPIGAGRMYEGVIFTPLAIALASIFVTFPFVARTLIPLMESQGAEAEQAALTLGASGWYTFRRVTLPSIKWGLLYGTILCTARALGEFGAVSVVSGHLDVNDTMPLRVEKLWQAYKTQPAFTVASLLAMTAVVTLVLKTFIEWMSGRDAEDDSSAKSISKPGH